MLANQQEGASAKGLRLLIPGEGWQTDDTPEEKGTQRTASAFIDALNASNLLVLTGAGASRCAKNASDKIQAPTMRDLWDEVKAKVTKSIFDEVCATFPHAPIDGNIEKLLSLCKIYLELHEEAPKTETNPALIQKFVKEAEEAILNRVDFVSENTNLHAHAAFIRKIARRGIRKPRAKLFTTNYDLCFARQGSFKESPLVVFLDEAHQFLGRTIGDEYGSVRLDSFGLIAKEGRKYGLTCVLATQRPRDIPQDVLSQLGTLFVHRLTNDQDRETVERACGDLDRAAAQFIPMLAPGEAILIGPDLPIPLPLKILKPTSEPDSKGPPYQAYWGSRGKSQNVKRPALDGSILADEDVF